LIRNPIEVFFKAFSSLAAAQSNNILSIIPLHFSGMGEIAKFSGIADGRGIFRAGRVIKRS
jgi:hypothetical protein